MDITRVILLGYAFLILVALVASMYTMWAYSACPSNRNHRPLIFPIICSMSWFLVGVDQLVATIGKKHGSVDGLTVVLLIAVTLGALLYFVHGYVMVGIKPALFLQRRVEMVKPYIYGGVALLIVGLSLYSWGVTEALWEKDAELEGLQAQYKELKESEQRKAGIILGYNNKSAQIDEAVDAAVKVISGYKKRDTPDEKCLDLIPPADLLRLLDKNNSGKGAAK